MHEGLNHVMACFRGAVGLPATPATSEDIVGNTGNNSSSKNNTFDSRARRCNLPDFGINTACLIKNEQAQQIQVSLVIL